LDLGKYRHAYLGRPRGHSKTGDAGTEAVTELMLGDPGRELYCAAADEEQARTLLRDVVGKFRRNPLLGASVDITRNEITVRATGSRLRVLAADAPTAYGLRPNWIVCDELAWWKKRDLWDALWSASVKNPKCRVIVITTAGWDFTSIVREVWEMARREENWYFSDRGPCAPPWIAAEDLEQQRRTLPGHVFARLHENRWVAGVGAYLTKDEVDGVFVDAIPAQAGPVAIGVDLGLSRDRSVIAVCRGAEGAVWVERLFTYLPGPREEKVDLASVELAVRQAAVSYGGRVILDPWQAVFMEQRLAAKGIRAESFVFTPENRRKLFGTLLDLIRSGRLRCREHGELRKELLGLNVAETPGGWKVEHKGGAHDDHVVAVALAAQALRVDAAPVDFREQSALVERSEVADAWAAAREAWW